MGQGDNGAVSAAAAWAVGRLCVVIPVFNAERTIGALVQAVKRQGFHALVVDDGSSDRSASSAAEAGAFVISFLSNQGKGAALRVGYSRALRERYDAVITMDGDGQHDPAEIPMLLEVAQAQRAGMVLGNRMSNVASMPMARRMTNGIMSRIVSWLTGQRIPDSQCGFRFIRLDVLAGLPLSATRYEIDTEVLLSAAAAGCKIVSVPIRTIYASEGSHIRPVRDTVRFLVFLLRRLVGPQ
jgi:glycosyltransferase involved in cell wall biosynthesis